MTDAALPREPADLADSQALAAGQRVLRLEGEALLALAAQLDGTFERFVEGLAEVRGRVVVTEHGAAGKAP